MHLILYTFSAVQVLALLGITCSKEKKIHRVAGGTGATYPTARKDVGHCFMQLTTREYP